MSILTSRIAGLIPVLFALVALAATAAEPEPGEEAISLVLAAGIAQRN